jgi:DNA modification methylase
MRNRTGRRESHDPVRAGSFRRVSGLMMTNKLYYGDNLDILREFIPDESIDLVYLDPPFNSNATYNVLFKAPGGEQSQSQIEAFDDTWHWGERAERAFDEVMTSGNTDAAEMLRAMRGFLKENDMMAYLAMMAVRLIQLHRVLKPTGSLYLHCDPTASHYLKILLDAVFGKENYLNEIIWRRTSSHSSAKRWGPVHDTLFFYAKGQPNLWNPTFEEYDQHYVDQFYRFEDEDGRFRVGDLTGAGRRTGDSGKPWRGIDPTEVGRHWAVPTAVVKRLGFNGDFDRLDVPSKLDRLDELGLIYWPPKGRVPQFKRYLEVDRGSHIQDVISDIKPISSQAQERLGYPTQKPLALLERILTASSNEGDVVLDPFCGCGTTVHAAQKMGRRWIGIDITHLAIGLIKRRLIDAFPQAQFEILGVPKDADGAAALAESDKHQFQLWACSVVEAQPFKGGRKGADGGVDGYIYFKPDGKTTEKAIISVKGGKNVGVTMIRDLIAIIERERAKVGILLSLTEPTREMKKEAAAAGLYKTEMLGDFPRIQVLTIDDLFLGERPRLPWVDPSVFKKAKRENTHKQEDLF